MIFLQNHNLDQYFFNESPGCYIDFNQHIIIAMGIA